MAKGRYSVRQNLRVGPEVRSFTLNLLNLVDAALASAQVYGIVATVEPASNNFRTWSSSNGGANNTSSNRKDGCGELAPVMYAKQLADNVIDSERL